MPEYILTDFEQLRLNLGIDFGRFRFFPLFHHRIIAADVDMTVSWLNLMKEQFENLLTRQQNEILQDELDSVQADVLDPPASELERITHCQT